MLKKDKLNRTSKPPSKNSSTTSERSLSTLRIIMQLPAIATLCSILAVASASHFVAYQGEYFSGSNSDLSNCGCQNIPYHGSYHWYHNGQSGDLYNAPNCQGARNNEMPSDSDQSSKTSYGWQSL
ncbi:hypothetical protein BGX28_000919, partial [Mortierella sp. GBA30]